MNKKIFQVKGMHCASCAAVIEQTVKKLDGISDASVNFASEKLFVKYDHPIEDYKIMEAVEKTGYKLASDDINMKPGEHMMKMDHEHLSIESAVIGHNHLMTESDAEIYELKKKLLFGIFAAIITVILSFGGQFLPFIPKNLGLIILLLLSTPVEFWVGKQFWRGAYYEFKNIRPGMDSLVAIGTGTAYFFSLLISVVNLIPEFNKLFLAKFDPYFDVAVVVTVFIILGKYLEAKAKGSASEAIKKLLKLQAKIAHLIDANGNVRDIDINNVEINDILFIKQGEKIPTDGIIIEGSAPIDESMVTGESLPVDKKEGDSVIGATINQSGTFKMKALKVGKDTFLSQIIQIVEEAQASKAPIQRLADKITGIFVPIVMAIALITFLLWAFFGPQPWLTYALVNFVAVLAVACPCALGLATPIAVITGTGKGAEHGIIIRNAQSLEIAGKISAIILDKTGTITKGQPSVTEIIAAEKPAKTEAELLQIAASLSKNSTHPLSKAVVEESAKRNIDVRQLSEFSEIPGKGIRGEINGIKYLLGNKKLLSDWKINIEDEVNQKSEKHEHQGETVLFLTDEKDVLGIISIADIIKESAKETVEKIKDLGIEVWMITGDNERTADTIARKVGITNIIASVLPGQKSQKIKELQEKGKIVAMVGDGINDAPALTQADIGIAIGTGTCIAIESAGITLTSGDPIGVYKAVLLSKNTLKNIKQNLFWAYAYNIVLIPIAAGVLYPAYGILLNPMIAGTAMAFSSLSVVLNSLRIKNLDI